MFSSAEYALPWKTLRTHTRDAVLHVYAARLGRSVLLLDLTAGSTWVVRAGGHHGVAHEQHAVSQHWARAIRAVDSDLDGIVYRSSYGPFSSVVLFYPAADALTSAVLDFERPLQHTELRHPVVSSADQLGYDIG